MTVDKSFLIKKIQKREAMIVAYCSYTNMPLVVCDPETFNDQVWIFETEALLQEFAKKYTAVSYTHLDVYKRQPLTYPCRPRF